MVSTCTPGSQINTNTISKLNDYVRTPRNPQLVSAMRSRKINDLRIKCEVFSSKPNDGIVETDSIAR